MEPYIGEIKIFAGNFAPINWAICDGRLLPVNNDTAPLFSLLGTFYGGDGRTTFGLPDMRGRLPVHFGAGPGLTQKLLGQRFGNEMVTLTLDQIPNHNHNIQASSNTASLPDPTDQVLAKSATETTAIYAQVDPSKTASMPADMIGHTGGDQPHTNIMPLLSLNFIIALQGIYPPRN